MLNLGKLINREYIIEDNIQKGNTSDNFWYKKIKYVNKPYYLMKKQNLQLKRLYYYCNNHSTTRLSTDNKKHSICNSKIAYDKSNKQYILLEEHSNQCLNIIKPVVEIMISSSNLINNYSNFKAELIKQLERHPFQNYSTFCKTATNLYNKDSYEFSLTPSNFKNIYYPWKKFLYYLQNLACLIMIKQILKNNFLEIILIHIIMMIKEKN